MSFMGGFTNYSVLLNLGFQMFQPKLVGAADDIALRDFLQILLRKLSHGTIIRAIILYIIVSWLSESKRIN